MQQQAVRWNVRVSKNTDNAVRAFLGSRGRKKGDFSQFVEHAVRAQVFHNSVLTIKAQNADTDPDELQGLIDATVREVRAHRTRKAAPRRR